jgi:hypothetical protein
MVVADVRRYLVENLSRGTIETVSIETRLGGDDLKRAMNGGPIPDESVAVRFAIRGAELKIGEGLPPLADLSIGGAVTGIGTSLQAQGARAPPSRRAGARAL